jgi:hypothetical protein
MSDRIGTIEAREEGDCWVVLGSEPAQFFGARLSAYRSSLVEPTLSTFNLCGRRRSLEAAIARASAALQKEALLLARERQAI